MIVETPLFIPLANPQGWATMFWADSHDLRLGAIGYKPFMAWCEERFGPSSNSFDPEFGFHRWSMIAGGSNTWAMFKHPKDAVVFRIKWCQV